MKIAIVTDAWFPQINGVVRTIKTTVDHLSKKGHQFRIINAAHFVSFPLPGYPEIRLALFPKAKLTRMLDEFQPDAIHIATEGTLGFAARKYCLKRKLRFSTAYHTRFPEYVRLRAPVPLSWLYAVVRRFHNAADVTMVATDSLKKELQYHGFRNLKPWSRGVDTDLFRRRPKLSLPGQRPMLLYVGRVAVEKNIEKFLSLDIPGTKYIIGDGPATAMLKKKYPDTQFLGYKTGEDLAHHVASADVMVFPSETDTFGLVIIEAMAAGVPVAAYPVTGPKDIIQNGVNGWVDEDLGLAVKKSLEVEPLNCSQFAKQFSWENAAAQFESNLVSARRG